MLGIFSCVYWLSVCLPWRNVYLGLLHIFPPKLFFFFINFYNVVLVSDIQCEWVIIIHTSPPFPLPTLSLQVITECQIASAHLFIYLFLILSRMHCLYILETNPLLVASFANIFSPSQGCLFVLFMVSFTVEKLLSLIRSHLFILFSLI